MIFAISYALLWHKTKESSLKREQSSDIQESKKVGAGKTINQLPFALATMQKKKERHEVEAVNAFLPPTETTVLLELSVQGTQQAFDVRGEDA